MMTEGEVEAVAAELAKAGGVSWHSGQERGPLKLVMDRYRDPLLEADGPAGLSEMVATVHGHYPGHRFRRTSGIDAHHDVARFGWELVAPDGAVFVAGVDVATLADDGRLRTILGFFGDPPPARTD